MKRAVAREQLFEEEFARVYLERWNGLRSALLEPSAKTVLKNPFGSDWQDYSLDPASVVAARALDVRAGMKYADFCASPGGKSLASIFAVHAGGASVSAAGAGITAAVSCEWNLNDLSPARVARLRAVMHDCLPPAVLPRVRISTSDASRWGLRRAGEFDRILVDAPCSGERHLLGAPSELARWSMKAVKGLVVRQHSLLCSALDCLKPGGRLVYSTCAIHPLENDGVVGRLSKSREGQFRVLDVSAEMPSIASGIEHAGSLEGEATEFGRIILPDTSGGAGPIYFSVIEKV
jgi:16S rRNA C967 or C1407 C5-methylase (RsmB/RsmF family)